MKRCSKCRKNQPLSAYWRDRSKKHGRMARCKDCKRKYDQAYRRSHPAMHKTRYRDNREKELERHMRKTHGIGFLEYESMFATQGGCCAICGGLQDDGRRLDIDHCHSAGNIRGLLCSNCNWMLGNAKDKPETLRLGAAYLEASTRKSPRNSSKQQNTREEP